MNTNKKINTLDGLPLWLLAKKEHMTELLYDENPYLLINKYDECSSGQAITPTPATPDVFTNPLIVSDFCKTDTMAIPLRKAHRNMSNLITIGRLETNDVVLTRKCVSKKHCSLYQWSGMWFILDTNSSNGTCLNGEKIEPMTRKQIVSQDIISIGLINCIFISPLDIAILLSQNKPLA